MKSIAAARALLLLEEGAAFAMLEGEATMISQTENTTNTTSATNATSATTAGHEEHVAPVEAWDAIAAGYDAHVTDREAGLATLALTRAGLKAGDRFLDVAAGTGGLTLPAARLGAKVIATDWSAKMIERFDARVREQGLAASAEGKVMDCHALAFSDDTFDVTGSQFGVMLVPDQERALREMVRVTKKGGRVLLVAYGSPAAFEALQFFIAGLRSVNPGFEGLPSNPPPLEFQVADPEVMKQRLTAAGLRDVTVDTTQQERVELRSAQDLWDWCVGSNPIPGMLVADLSEPQRAAVRKHIDGMLHERAERAGRTGIAVLTAAVNIGIGTK